MKIALYLILASVASTQLSAQAVPPASQPTREPAPAMATNASPDLATRESLIMVQAMAQKSDTDVARLRISKWKADSQNKQQSEANAASIRKNLTTAIPDLLLRVQTEPGSLIANFRLYRNLNALYDSFSALAESAGAFGPEEQYTPLTTDIAQLDQVRRQFAQRMDLLAEASDAELARLRAATLAKPATKAATAKSGTKIVVDDSHPTPKKKPKPSVTKPATAKPAAAKPAAAAGPTDPEPASTEPAAANDSQPATQKR